jgi:hypothetical protein
MAVSARYELIEVDGHALAFVIASCVPDQRQRHDTDPSSRNFGRVNARRPSAAAEQLLLAILFHEV